jgi:FkbM family methyltransferase
MLDRLKQTLLKGFLFKHEWDFIKAIVPSKIKKIVRGWLADGEMGVLCLGGGIEIKYFVNDAYWYRIWEEPTRYEPEIFKVLEEVLDTNTVFIDGGANIGFWSSFSSSKIRNKNQVFAIEAGSRVLKNLNINCKHSTYGFTVVEKALYSISGEKKEFTEYEDHSGSSLIKEWRENDKVISTKIIETISLDKLIDEAITLQSNIEKIVIKLDVEGVEIEAFKGARVSIQKKRNLLFIYEDHGKDFNSETTNYLLNASDFNVYYYCSDTRVMVVISSLLELKKIKRNVIKGYNFFATIKGTSLDSQMQKMVELNPSIA